MQDILVLGAGKIGALISGLLADCGDYRVQLADSQDGAAADVAQPLEDAEDLVQDALERALRFEHKTVFAFEAGDSLVPSAVQRFVTWHPRCGR